MERFSKSLWVSLTLAAAASTSSLAQTAPQRSWLNQPKVWSETVDGLKETVPAGTDFWRLADAAPDNAPFRYQVQLGDFEAKVRVSGNYHELYHQAGLMVRIDNKTWIKTGIEFVKGKQNISAVVTRGFSDWSIIPRNDNPPFVWIRLQRQNDAIKMEYSFDGSQWTMYRLAYFPPHVPVKIGMFATAPGKQSFDVTFDHFHVGPLAAPVKDE